MGLCRCPAPKTMAGVDLDTLKALKLDELREARIREIETGRAEIETRIGKVLFWTARDAAADLGFYVQEITLAMASGQQPQNVVRKWKTAGGVMDLPGDVAIHIGKSLADWNQVRFNKEAALGAMAMAAETPEDVEAITWETVPQGG